MEDHHGQLKGKPSTKGVDVLIECARERCSAERDGLARLESDAAGSWRSRVGALFAPLDFDAQNDLTEFTLHRVGCLPRMFGNTDSGS
jgi:hypothetical protein